MPARVTVDGISNTPAATPSARRFTFFIISKLCLVDFRRSVNDYKLFPQSLRRNQEIPGFRTLAFQRTLLVPGWSEPCHSRDTPSSAYLGWQSLMPERKPLHIFCETTNLFCAMQHARNASFRPGFGLAQNRNDDKCKHGDRLI